MTTPGVQREAPGLQPERTELAWRRTVLALAIGALVSVRVLPGVLGGWTVATGLAGVGAAVVLWVASHRRTQRSRMAFRGSHPEAMPGGVLLLATALLTAAGAALGLLYLLAGLARPA